MGATQASEIRSTQESQSPPVYEVISVGEGGTFIGPMDGLYSVCGRLNDRNYFVNIRAGGSAIFFDGSWKLGSDLENWSYCIDSNALTPPTGKWSFRQDSSKTCDVSTRREVLGNTMGSGMAARAGRTVGGASSRSSRTRGGAPADWSEFETSYHALAGRLMSKQRSSFDVYAVKRAQDQLSGCDVAKLHGYVILWLTTPDQTDNIYVRIDWTDGGFEVAEKSGSSVFDDYITSHPEAAAAGERDVYKFTGAVLAGTVVAFAGVFCVSNPVGASVALAAQLVGSGTLLGTTYVTGSADEAKLREQFVVVNKSGKTDGALQHLLVMLERHQAERKQYDLATWNCNHVANAMLERLLVAGDVV